MLTFLSFLVALGILVTVHEYGHYRMARACGIDVLQFSIGFGAPLFRWRLVPGGTEFVLALIPLGGFVKMLDERDGPVPATARHRAFNTQCLRNRALVVLAGPFANLTLAALIYAAVGMIGTQEPKAVLATPGTGSVAERAGLRSGDWVVTAQVSGQEPKAVDSFNGLRSSLMLAVLNGDDVILSLTDQEGGPVLRHVELPLSNLNFSEPDIRLLDQLGFVGPRTPAILTDVALGSAGDAAGLKRGDLVRMVGDSRVADAQQLRSLIRKGVTTSGESVSQVWAVERGGGLLKLVVSPQAVFQDGLWVGRAGIYLASPPDMTLVRTGVLDSVWSAGLKTWDMAMLTLNMTAKMFTGQASVKNLSGPLAIADQAGKSATAGLVAYALFLAVISVSLGVLNLLPIPVLDGGHLMYYLYEALTGREPSAAWVDTLQRGGMTLLVGMMAVALFNDVARLLG